MLSKEKFWEINSEINSFDENGRYNEDMTEYTVDELNTYDEMKTKVDELYADWQYNGNEEAKETINKMLF